MVDYCNLITLMVFRKRVFFFLVSFVIRKTFSFANQSVIDMLQAVVAHCEDSAEFNFDCRSIDWDEYIKTCVRGLQKYKLNCDEASLPSARRALKG